MIDAINMIVALPECAMPSVVCSSQIQDFYWQGLHFFPSGEYRYVANKQSLQRLDLSNLYISFGTGTTAKLKIANSLHKISHDGYNHTDFTKSQLEDVIHHLCSTLDIPPESMSLQGNLEFSVNIVVEDAQFIIENAIKHKNKGLQQMNKKGKVYGKKAIYTNYFIKIYNPLAKIKLEGNKGGLKIIDTNNVLRVEITAKADYIRRSWSIPVHSLSSLQKDTVLTALGQRLGEMSKGFIFNIKPPKMTFKQTQIWYTFTHMTPSETQRYNKGTGKSNFYNQRKKYKDLCKQSNIDLSTKIREKWAFLQAH
jgi:hypothetical protein